MPGITKDNLRAIVIIMGNRMGEHTCNIVVFVYTVDTWIELRITDGPACQ